MPTLGITPKRRNSSTAPLTPRQADLILAVRMLSATHRTPPSLTELAVEMGISQGTVSDLVRSAVAKGYLTKSPGKYRSLLLTAAGLTVKNS